MTTKEKSDIIHKWLLENGLYYDIDPSNTKEVHKYVDKLFNKSVELYKHLLLLDIVKEGSYDSFKVMLENSINIGYSNAVFR